MTNVTTTVATSVSPVSSFISSATKSLLENSTATTSIRYQTAAEEFWK